jgi:hypothetical protein
MCSAWPSDAYIMSAERAPRPSLREGLGEVRRHVASLLSFARCPAKWIVRFRRADFSGWCKMKVVIEYKPSDAGKALGAENPISLRIGLPKSWVAGNVKKIKAFFIDEYKKKHPTAELNADEWHVVAADGRDLGDEVPVAEHIAAGDELTVVPGAPPATTLPRPPPPVRAEAPSTPSSTTSAATPAADPNQLMCLLQGPSGVGLGRFHEDPGLHHGQALHRRPEDYVRTLAYRRCSRSCSRSRGQCGAL